VNPEVIADELPEASADAQIDLERRGPRAVSLELEDHARSDSNRQETRDEVVEAATETECHLGIGVLGGTGDVGAQGARGHDVDLALFVW
jgi:hypothetical protein